MHQCPFSISVTHLLYTPTIGNYPKKQIFFSPEPFNVKNPSPLGDFILSDPGPSRGSPIGLLIVLERKFIESRVGWGDLPKRQLNTPGFAIARENHPDSGRVGAVARTSHW